jgi:hypothetical protein
LLKSVSLREGGGFWFAQQDGRKKSSGLILQRSQMKFLIFIASQQKTQKRKSERDGPFALELENEIGSDENHRDFETKEDRDKKKKKKKKKKASSGINFF